MAVGGESFRAVDDPGAVADRRGARAASIGTRFRLGERPAAELFALRQRRHVFLASVLRCRIVDVIGAKRIVRGDDDADGAIDARKLFDGDNVLDVAESRAAVFLRENHAEQAHVGELGD